MKIYRAVFNYNNADTCEWENWYAKRSVWYSRKELAEQHLEDLNKFKDYLKNEYFKDYQECFKCYEPWIEEQEVNENFVPLEIDYKDVYKFD